MTAKVL